MSLETLDALMTTALDQASRQKASLKLIDPGHPERSYLVDKLRNRDIAAFPSTGMR